MSGSGPRRSPKVVRENIFVTHHLLLLVENAYDPGGAIPPPVSGLVGIAPRCVAIFTGINTGNVDVTVSIRDTRPSTPPAAEWEDVAEATLRVGGEWRLATLMSDIPTTLPVISTAKGSLRLRVSCSGRDDRVDGVAEQPYERYLLEAWPEQTAARMVHRLTTEYGRGLAASADAWEISTPAQRGDDPVRRSQRRVLEDRGRRARDREANE